MKNKLIFTSYGLTTKEEQKLIGKELGSYELEDKKIFLFHEPHYYTESILVMACVNLGFKEENIILSGHQRVIRKFWNVISIIAEKATRLRNYPY